MKWDTGFSMFKSGQFQSSSRRNQEAGNMLSASAPSSSITPRLPTLGSTRGSPARRCLLQSTAPRHILVCLTGETRIRPMLAQHPTLERRNRASAYTLQGHPSARHRAPQCEMWRNPARGWPALRTKWRG